MSRKRVARVYSEQAMLADLKDRKLQVIPVKQNVREIGKINDYVKRIKYIIIGSNNIGVVRDDGKVEEFCGRNHGVMRQPKRWWFKDAMHLKPCKSDQDRYKTVMLGMRTTRAFAQLYGIFQDIVDRNGETRDTYDGFEVNHMDCSGSWVDDADETWANLELVTDHENGRAGKASHRLFDNDIWCSFSASDTEFVSYVLSDEFTVDEFWKLYPKTKFKIGRTVTREFSHKRGVKTLTCMIK